jgi:stage V sporulation protein B
MSQSQSLAKSTLWVTISEIIFNLSGYVIHSVVGRILGPADYGRYGLVVTLTTMIIILIGNGIPTAMAKYMSEIFATNPSLVPVIKRQAMIMQSILIATITVLFYLFSPLLAAALGDQSLTHLFRISVWIIPSFALASFYFSYYTGLHKFNLQSVLKTVRSILKVVIIVSLAWFWRVPGSILGYAAAAGSVYLIALGIDKIVFSKDLQKRIEEQKKTAEKPIDIFFDYRKLLNYAWQVILFFLAYELLISIDLYLVKGILHDDYLTGIYNAALTVGRIPYYIFYALTVMLLPVISKTTAENNHRETNKIISQSLRLMFILLIPGVILMAQFARPIIKIFYSRQYIDAAYPMSILVYGVGFLTIFYVMSFVLNGAGKTKIPMGISIFGVILNTLLNSFLIRKYGLVGSATATTLTSFVAMLIVLFYIQRDFGKIMSLSSLLKMGCAGFGMYLASLFFSKGEFIFVFWSLVLFSLYLIMLYLLKEIRKEDLVLLKEIISRKKTNHIKEELSGNEPSA